MANLLLPVKLLLLIFATTAICVLWQREQLAALALVRIDPVPETRTLVAEERYAAAADYLGFFMDYDYVQQDPAAQTLYSQIEAVRADPAYQTDKFAEGLIQGTSDEVIGQAAGVTSDFFVIGDLRDLLHQGRQWAKDEEVDEVITALAAIGLAASAAQAASAVTTVGTVGVAAPSVAAATAVKGGVSLLKLARKANKLPPWLVQASREAAEQVTRGKTLDGVQDLFVDLYRLARHKGGVALLGTTTDALSLKRLARATDTFGDQTVTLYRLGGDAFLATAQQAAKLGAATIKLAATYGQEGLRLLDRIGTLKFVKYTARGGKLFYKGDVLRLLARLLAELPTWVLYLLVTAGALVWMPWRSSGFTLPHRVSRTAQGSGST